MTARPRALVTNDDGVDSAGIAVLASMAAEVGFDVVIAAPSWDSSGASASLTAVEEAGRVIVGERSIDLDVPVYGVEAAPAFIVRAALSGAFGPAPDVVLSGVNHGSNLGHVILHSGTVGAALTASTHGLRAMAASLEWSSEGWQWDTARRALDTVLPWLLAVDRAVVLNLNVPAVGPEAMRGVAAARLARLGTVQVTLTEAGAGWVRMAYESAVGDYEPGTDAAMLAEGWATITPLTAVCESSFDDLGGLALASATEGARR
jgi:5'-nucleotidase